MENSSTSVSPSFITIRSLLNDPDNNHVGIAIEIELNGVYSFDANQNATAHHRPDSLETESALNSLSVDLKLSNDPPDDDGAYETWWSDQDTTYIYGWPANQVPKFRTSSDDWLEHFSLLHSRSSLFSPNLFTLGRLLLTGRAKVGTIATAIDRHGIYGYDKMGRLLPVGSDPWDQAGVLDLLRKYIHVANGRRTDALKVLDDPEFAKYGWPQEYLPDFAAIAAEPVTPIVQSAPASPIPPSPEVQSALSNASLSAVSTASTKGENANLAIIGGLLAIIKGELGCQAHPDFNSQQQVIDLLTRELNGLNGTGERNLKQKFRDANILLEDYLNPGGVSKR